MISKILIIGERLNSSNPRVKKLFQEQNDGELLDVAQEQVAGGASYIDLNASMIMKGEEEALRWGARIVSTNLEAGVSLDSPNTDVLLKVIPEFGSRAILNSLTTDEEVLGEALPVVSDCGGGVVVILKSREGIPATADGRLSLAETVVTAVSKAGIPPGKVFLDPIFSPLATSMGGLSVALETIAGLRREYPEFQRIGGLSNISFGLPSRRLLNRTFLAMVLSQGLTAVICDSTDRRIVETLKTSEAILGLDPGIRNFLQFYRDSRKSR